jgi:hypothetical protein
MNISGTATNKIVEFYEIRVFPHGFNDNFE